jgi:hypothetical protein
MYKLEEQNSFRSSFHIFQQKGIRMWDVEKDLRRIALISGEYKTMDFDF